jgi:hypothetical protein
MTSHTPAHPGYMVAGMLIFLLCGCLAKMKVNRWKKAEGIAPAPSFTREGNREYKKMIWQMMPMQIQQQFYGLIMIGFVAAAIGLWLAD